MRSRSALSPAEKVAADVALALATPFRPFSERQGRVSPRREIACRSCGRWMTYGEAGPWRHEDGTLACLDPATLRPQAAARCRHCGLVTGSLARCCDAYVCIRRDNATDEQEDR